MLADLGYAVQVALIYYTIIYLTGAGGLFSERSGIVNIGLEGMLIIGTVTGSAGAHHFGGPIIDGGLGWPDPWGPLMGLAFGLVAGAAFAAIHALATVTFRVDHIVSGVVINLLAIGVARFLSSIFFGQATQSDPGQPKMSLINLPLLSDIPGFGRAFEGMSPFVVIALLAVIPIWYVLYRLRWGLRLRSAGENPEATRSLGVRVAPLRWEAVLLSGALAGLAGAFLSVEATGQWREGQTQGLGFIALAALILSNWNPVRLMGAAFLFGFAQSIPLTLYNWPIIRDIPEAFLNMVPYVVTIVVLAGFVGKVRPPAAAGRAYEGGGG